MTRDGSPPSAWRAAGAEHLLDIVRIAERVHPDHPEAPAVFAERLALYPAGCLVLAQADAIAGYVISHPWRHLQAPTLDQCLGALPCPADGYLIHDVALLPGCRGSGHGRAAVLRLQTVVLDAGLAEMSLVSLPRSVGFWTMMGFRPVQAAGTPGHELAAYGPGAVLMEKRLQQGRAGDDG